MISLRALKERRAAEFEEDEFSWRERNEIVMQRRRSRFRKQIEWLQKQPWQVRVFLGLTLAMVCYVAIVMGFMMAVALAAEQPPSTYPLCAERAQVQELIKAILAKDRKWVEATLCPIRPAGEVVVIEPGFDVVKVRVLRSDGGSAVGYTINWKNALP